MGNSPLQQLSDQLPFGRTISAASFPSAGLFRLCVKLRDSRENIRPSNNTIVCWFVECAVDELAIHRHAGCDDIVGIYGQGGFWQSGVYALLRPPLGNHIKEGLVRQNSCHFSQCCASPGNLFFHFNFHKATAEKNMTPAIWVTPDIALCRRNVY